MSNDHETILLKLDEILKILKDQKAPLEIMENHVYNVENVVERVPFLRKLVKSTQKSEQIPLLKGHCNDN